MRRILVSHGVDPERVVLDEDSKDTLQNVVAAARFIRAANLEGAVICTDSYHAPRVSMLFHALGLATENGPLARGRGSTAWTDWNYMRARELAAYVYDFAVIMRRGPELRTFVTGG